MTHEECYELGFIQKTHGMKGEIVMALDVDDSSYYEDMDSVFIEINKQLVPFFIEKIQINNERAITKLEEIDTFEKAKELVGCILYLPLDRLPELDEDKFYYHEIIGYTVNDKNLGELGKITNFHELPMQDVLVMEYHEKEVLIPVSDEIVLGIDHEKNILQTSLPVGLLEIYMESSSGEPDDADEELLP